MSTYSPRARRRERTPLALTGVLASGLPPALGTPQAPARYMVPAVFTRAPSPREIAILQSAPLAARLAVDHPGVSLRVSDRRLEIHGTNLAELRQGLAAVVAGILAEATSVEDDEDASRLAAAEALAADELERAHTVAAEAARISFVVDGPGIVERVA